MLFENCSLVPYQSADDVWNLSLVDCYSQQQHNNMQQNKPQFTQSTYIVYCSSSYISFMLML